MTKEQILQELEQLPEPILVKVLEFARTLQLQTDQATEANLESRIWQAYLESERERREVYQRLANS